MPVPSYVRARVGDAVETLEEVWDLVCWNPRPGVAAPERHVIATPAQADGNLAREGKLEGIREQVEDDLLPHVAIHIDGLRQRWALHRQAESGSRDSGAKNTGELGSHRGEVSRLIAGLNAACLEAREI